MPVQYCTTESEFPSDCEKLIHAMSLDAGLEVLIMKLAEKYSVCCRRLPCSRVITEICMRVNSRKLWKRWTFDALHSEQQQQTHKLLSICKNIVYVQALQRQLSEIYDCPLYHSLARQPSSFA